MASKTKIPWTDATWNITGGCDPCSLGCEHCAAVRGVSIEPMLGAVDIRKYISLRQKCVDGLRKKGCGFTGSSDEFNHPQKEGAYRCPKCKSNHDYLITPSIDWVILGGESGPGARYCPVKNIRDIVEQCKAANVKCFVKQIHQQYYLTGGGQKLVKDIDKFPEDLKIRQYPEAKSK